MSEEHHENDNLPAEAPAGLLQRAEAVIDPRMADCWTLAWEAGDPVPAEAVARLMRLAYATGYRDAVEEPVPGSLLRGLGIVTPSARNRRPEARRGSSPASRGSSDR